MPHNKRILIIKTCIGILGISSLSIVAPFAIFNASAENKEAMMLFIFILALNVALNVGDKFVSQ